MAAVLRRLTPSSLSRILGRLGGGGMEWIQLAQYRGWWRAVVKVVMNLRGLAPRSWLVSSVTDTLDRTRVTSLRRVSRIQSNTPSERR
jgi:hypothetical protein